MKKISLLLVLAFVALSSCEITFNKNDHTKLQSEQRVVKPFEAIDISHAVTVYYQQGTTTSVKVMCDKSEMKDVITESDGKTLVIKIDDMRGFGFLRNHSTPEIYVTSPDLISVSLSGSGDFISDKIVDTDILNVSLAGSGDIKMKDIICDEVKGSLVGSGDLDLDNVTCKKASLYCTGSGDLDAKINDCKFTNLSLTGSGDVDVNMCNSNIVNSSVAGSGDITIKGNIKQLNRNVEGSGDIHIEKLKIENQK